MSLPYLTLPMFRVRTLMGVGEVDYVETDSPGFIVARIAVQTSYIHARLRKRYGASLPFGDPVPEVILGWLTALVTLDVMRKRGLNPQDPTAQMYAADSERAMAEIKEASDSEAGLFDLPSPEEGDSNVTTGGPLGYSEASPYVWTELQGAAGRNNDRNHNGDGDD